MSKAYYNEIDPFAAAWLRSLIAEKLIADGDVDERSIRDVSPADLLGYTQCHFFAGIGVWSYALRLAGWPDERPVWTGSCPCQPFSAAGKQEGVADARHLWPDWARLIRECKPAVLFGEQVASAIGHGWLDLVSDDLEAEGYAIGAAVFPACSVGAPHIRQRLYFVADAQHGGCGAQRECRRLLGQLSTKRTDQPLPPAERSTVGDLAESEQLRFDARNAGNGRTEEIARSESGQVVAGCGGIGVGLADAERRRCEQRDAGQRPVSKPDASGKLGQPIGAGLEGLAGNGDGGHQPGRNDAREDRPVTTAGAWAGSYWLSCKDGKVRPVPLEPAFFPLVDGPAPGRVGLLRGAGNAIVAPQAETFIRIFMDLQP